MEFSDLKCDVDKAMSQEDKRALNLMVNSVNVRNGHYEISLSWRKFPPVLPNNRTVAERRLNLLKKKLIGNPDRHRKYSAFMGELLEKGYAQRVTKEQLGSKEAWYLPHRAVIHPRKPEKVRVVFDCAAKYQGTSINNQLVKGPDLTNSVVGVLLRFREETTAIMADVESMFYQVQVPSRDSNYLRYLWWSEGDLTRDPQEYQMLVHLFGGVSSPSCANFALRRTADDNCKEFDESTVRTVISSAYDPLGFVAPFLAPAKAILQGLSRKGLDWDDPIPLEGQDPWRAWLEQLSTLHQCTVNRCLKPKNFGRVMSSHLHNFADASQQGYGAVSYLRVVNEDGDVHCAIVMGKSRVPSP